MRPIHFLGIAGIGVSALAQMAQARGAKVSGSDPQADPDTNPAIARLRAGGATIYRTHRAENLAGDVALVVASAAVAEDNPEIRNALVRDIRVISRAAFLGELMGAHKGPKIAVAGTHGKTTTTAMIGVMLQHAGLDPTVFVGGEVAQLGGNIRIGSLEGPFVAEACEAYDSFLSLKPDLAVITNLEADHLDHFGTYDNVAHSFQRFVGNIPRQDGNGVVYCADDRNTVQMMQSLNTLLSNSRYGVESEDLQSCGDAILSGSRTRFDWIYQDAQVRSKTEITLQVPGRHNILNALAAATVGARLGLGSDIIAEGLAAFRGAERRQEILGEVPGEGGSILVMDDYAHHPTEIRATLEALRSAYPDRRLVAVFQPHLYSRTRDFLPQFAETLALADALVVTDIYAAREARIEGVHAAEITALVSVQNKALPTLFVPDKHDLPGKLNALVHPNDLVVFLGAGDIREQGEIFLRRLQPTKGAV